MIDDAFHYLKRRGLVAHHCSVKSTSMSGDASSSICAISPKVSPTVSRSRLFIWSAADEGGLSRLATLYRDYLETTRRDVCSDRFLDSLAYTLSNRRSSLPWKSFLLADSVESICEGLTRDQLSKPVRSSYELNPIIAFIFTGQGGQWYAMGRELLIYPIFQASLCSAEKYLLSLGCTWSLIGEMSHTSVLTLCTFTYSGYR